MKKMDTKRSNETLVIPSNSSLSIKKLGNTDGYDGHCLRAYYYFKDRMPDIDGTSVESVNSISKKYPELRQLSKAPTFA